jgi:hypothetical protein
MLLVPLWDTSKCVWSDSLRPVGLDGDDREPFDEWWSKHQSNLANLDKTIAEQWIYRHWDESPFGFIPLDDLSWECRLADSETFLSTVDLFFGGPADAEHDYRVFHENQLSTTQNWVNGTWTIPPIVLETPGGFRFQLKTYPNTRLLLLEGSKRYRYLHALHAKGFHTSLHKFFVIRSPLCN